MLEDAKLIFCNGVCQKEVPEYHFVEHMLVEWRAAELLISAKCTRCVVQGMDTTAELLCQTCEQTKHVSSFSPVALKQWLVGLRRAYLWTCYDCQCLACCLCAAENRPLHAIKHNALIDGRYDCLDHRYPLCEGCGAQRPYTSTKNMFKSWKCSECLGSCYNCGEAVGLRCGVQADDKTYCSDACRYPTCADAECERARP